MVEASLVPGWLLCLEAPAEAEDEVQEWLNTVATILRQQPEVVAIGQKMQDYRAKAWGWGETLSVQNHPRDGEGGIR